MLTPEQIGRVNAFLEKSPNASAAEIARTLGMPRSSFMSSLANSGKRIEKRLVNIRPVSARREEAEAAAA